MGCGIDQEAIMRTTKNLVQAAAVVVFIIALSTRAVADSVSPASRLSAVAGGAMGDGMSDAGGMGHGSISATVEPRLGRSEAYRRRVALDAERAASVEGQTAECAAHGRTPPSSCLLIASTALQTGARVER
jgi:hypothetical protein